MGIIEQTNFSKFEIKKNDIFIQILLAGSSFMRNKSLVLPCSLFLEFLDFLRVRPVFIE